MAESDEPKPQNEPKSEPQSEPQATADAAQAAEASAAEARIRRITRIGIALVVVVLAWYLAADRMTPSTSVARVSGYVVPIAPEVSGTVSAVLVELNQAVSAGDVLVEIDKELFTLQVEQAEAELARAGEAIGADTGGVAAAEARVAKARAELAAAKRDGKRTETLAAAGVASQFRADNAQSRIEKGEAELEAALADLQTSKSNLGTQGAENSRIRSASAELAKARRDLEHATLRAPTDGGVTNVRVEVGRFASAGSPLMTFISSADVWVEAYLRENSIGRVKAGDPVEILLDVAPGRIFQGVVASTGFGVDWGRAADAGKLPSISNPSDWLREPQRFPVVIHFKDDESLGLRREGGQADVIIYTEGSGLLRLPGWLWIRIMSLLSYAY
ncbi:MAG: HlyD family secretion protein [Myxococcota bacterium]|nr:HlyD family secretion protein [Myxococcota bacterium]